MTGLQLGGLAGAGVVVVVGGVLIAGNLMGPSPSISPTISDPASATSSAAAAATMDQASSTPQPLMSSVPSETPDATPTAATTPTPRPTVAPTATPRATPRPTASPAPTISKPAPPTGLHASSNGVWAACSTPDWAGSDTTGMQCATESLSWDPAAAGVTGFKVYGAYFDVGAGSCPPSGGATLLKTLASSVTTLNVVNANGYPPGCFWVSAVNAAGESARAAFQ